MMTRQEIFNIVYIGLRDQDWVQSRDQFCMYRDAVGNKCAFGHLIPDDLYQTSVEGYTARNILTFTEDKAKELSQSVSNGIRSLNEYFKDKIHPEDYAFIYDLQGTHDNSLLALKMKSKFDKFAADYGLDIPQ